MKKNFKDIQDIDINLIKEYKNNPRDNDDAVSYVLESIKQFGFKVPLVIDKDNIIVTGHTRYKAAKQLGFKTLPCIIADDLTEKEINTFRIADNKISELSGWDFDKLNEELRDIQKINMCDFEFELMADYDIDDLFVGNEKKEHHNKSKEVQCPCCKQWFNKV